MSLASLTIESSLLAMGRRKNSLLCSVYIRENCVRLLLALLVFLLLLQYGFNIFIIRKHDLLTNVIGTYVSDSNGSLVFKSERWADGPQRFLHLLLRQPKQMPLPLCPETPPGLVGAVPVTFEKPTLDEMEDIHAELEPGGHWAPSNCTARHRVALVIPYRDREHHLRIFINHIHPFLQKQQLDYGIYLIEQTAFATFNRAMLLNIGFVEARKDYNYQCYIFHDVDLLPEDDRNLYDCPPQPRHMSAHVDTLAYRLPYESLFGGIEAFRKEHFELVNGFSNKFFGWGAEDDDMFNRLQHHDLTIIRYPREIARYKMIRHMKQYPSSKRFKYLYTGKLRFQNDGINNLKYKVVRLERRRLFTRILVNISEEEVLAEDRELLMLADLAPQYRDAIIGAEIAAQQMSNVMGEGIAQEYRGGSLGPVPEEAGGGDVARDVTASEGINQTSEGSVESEAFVGGMQNPSSSSSLQGRNTKESKVTYILPSEISGGETSLIVKNTKTIDQRNTPHAGEEHDLSQVTNHKNGLVPSPNNPKSAISPVHTDTMELRQIEPLREKPSKNHQVPPKAPHASRRKRKKVRTTAKRKNSHVVKNKLEVEASHNFDSGVNQVPFVRKREQQHRTRNVSSRRVAI